MLNKNKEQQSLLKARARALRNAEDKVQELRSENLALYEENKDLRNENEELRHVLRDINITASSNTYGNPNVVISKIIELSSDSESNR